MSDYEHIAAIALARAEKAEARVRELEQDAARYRWLRNSSLMYLKSGPICVAADQWGKPLMVYPEYGPGVPFTLDGRALDVAIDAARGERNE